MSDKQYRGYAIKYDKLTLLNAMRAGEWLRWVPAKLLGKPEELGRALFLNRERLSIGEEFLVVDMTADKHLWAREDYESGICTYHILESNLPLELRSSTSDRLKSALKALAGVVHVADRETDEFIAARAVLAGYVEKTVGTRRTPRGLAVSICEAIGYKEIDTVERAIELELDIQHCDSVLLQPIVKLTDE